MGLIEPLVAVLLGAVFLDERLTLHTVVGGVLILVAVGVVLDLRAPRTREPAQRDSASAKAPADKTIA
jgi:drug/metabolite transporter (DMT)-like permease